MIRKIACPMDFTPTAMDAAEYAAKLARCMNANLTLLHVQQVFIGEGVSLFSGGERESVSEAKVAAERLDEICNDINRNFKISCNHEIIASMGQFEKAIGEEAVKFDLIVIGTNKSGAFFRSLFGSHSYRVAKNSISPVLIIPEGYAYREISKLTFIASPVAEKWDIAEGLQEFANMLKPQWHVIHLSESDSAESWEVYNRFCKDIQEKIGKEQQVTFEKMIMDDELDSIRTIANREDVDFLVVSMERHGPLYNLFHANLPKELSMVINCPLMLGHY